MCPAIRFHRMWKLLFCLFCALFPVSLVIISSLWKIQDAIVFIFNILPPPFPFGGLFVSLLLHPFFFFFFRFESCSFTLNLFPQYYSCRGCEPIRNLSSFNISRVLASLYKLAIAEGYAGTKGGKMAVIERIVINFWNLHASYLYGWLL